MINFRVTELLERKKGYAEFVDLMVKETLDDPLRPPPRPRTTEQAPSTVAALAAQALRHPDDDKEWSLRPMPANYLANPDATTLDDLTSKRLLGLEETQIVLDGRKSAKNRIGDLLDTTGLYKKTKRKAVEAFIFSKPASLTEEELKKVTKLTPMESTLLDPPPAKTSWWSRLFNKHKPSDGIKEQRSKAVIKGNSLVIVRDDADSD